MAFFFFFLAPSMNGRAQLCWSFPNFNLQFGSGRHFAGLDDDNDEEVLLMKVLLIIEVVLEVERL